MSFNRSRRFIATFLTVMLSASLILTSVYADEPSTESVAEPTPPPPFSCPTAPIRIPLNNKLDVATVIKPQQTTSYAVSNTKVASVTLDGLVIPISKGTSYVTARAVNDMSQAGSKAATCKVTIKVLDPVKPKLTFTPKSEVRKVKVGSKSFSVQTLLFPKGMPVQIGLANNVVGQVESIKTMAERYKADYAVNGTYFEAYGGIPEPWNTLIADGQVVHLGTVGTTIGFAADGTAKMDSLRLKIEGGLNGSYQYPNNWYATFVNRTPSEEGSSSILFTSARGSHIGFNYGMAIVVKGGKVTKIAYNENVAIPREGFVLVLTGVEQQNLGRKFKVGDQAHFRVKHKDMDGNELDWSDVVTAVGAGPRVLKDGKVAIDAEKEGFTQAKIKTESAARSGIGIKQDGSIVVITVGSATIMELGEILRSLGAVQGMNLDGGGSSGLYAQGKLLTTPGRLISNALIFGTKLSY
ncbi:MAG: phosphodiester glycosidase family protein [Candidatus Cohnella colombiensis]|uniref:Phosphodiester glycosidase family protein n=1 Tax=Candidatus Cohnella colombiensis TaxID=3121368 RepID=A0AA95EY90_9BACL|nr:MAG: phosphodiester glycosidase family protein [Cohnella sp.]